MNQKYSNAYNQMPVNNYGYKMMSGNYGYKMMSNSGYRYGMTSSYGNSRGMMSGNYRMMY